MKKTIILLSLLTLSIFAKSQSKQNDSTANKSDTIPHVIQPLSVPVILTIEEIQQIASSVQNSETISAKAAQALISKLNSAYKEAFDNANKKSSKK